MSEDKLESARRQGQAQFDSILEMVEALQGWESAARAEGWDGPHKDQFGATYFSHKNDWDENTTTYAAPSWRALCESDEIEPDDGNDDARQAIEEDALSVEVRSDWHSPGASDETAKPAEYTILLCTGGPAVRIIGRLDDYCQPESAELQVQDWFTPWTAIRPTAPEGVDAEETMLAYARVFWFGE